MERVVLANGQVFDGTGAPLRAADVAVEGDRIVEIGTGLTGDRLVDLSGSTVMPGLIDAHVHVALGSIDLMKNLNTPFSYNFYLAERNLRRTLDLGITTARDASGADLGMQRALEDGLIDGPALHISIIALSQTGGHGDHTSPSGNCPEVLISYPGRPPGVVDGVDQIRIRVRELIREGANAIKVNTSGGVFSPRDDPRHAHFTDEELHVMVAEAERAGIYVMAHAHGTDGIKNAIRAGIRSIEHGTQLDDEAIELMLANGTWLVPTLGVGQFIIDAVEGGASVPAGIAEKARASVAMRSDSFRRAVDAGVKIAMGSDSAGESHGNNLIELRLMHEHGMSPLQVLHAATGSAAELLQISSDVGTLGPGMRADLLVVNGDPLDFARYPANRQAVFRNGLQVREAASR